MARRQIKHHPTIKIRINRVQDVPSYADVRKMILAYVKHNVSHAAPTWRLEAWVRMAYGYVCSNQLDREVVRLAIGSLIDSDKADSPSLSYFARACDHFMDELVLGFEQPQPGEVPSIWDGDGGIG